MKLVWRMVVCAAVLLSLTATPRVLAQQALGQVQGGQPMVMQIQVAAVAPAALPGALQFIPSKALIVLHIKNLQDLSDKIATWGKQLGLTDQVPEMGDVLGNMLTKAKIASGLNKSGDLAVCLLMTNGGQGGPEPWPLMLVPVSDYAAFLTNFTGVQANGAVSTITVSDGTTAYVSQWGGYAAISPKQEVLSLTPGGLTLTPAAQNELTNRDASFLVNMPAVRALVIPLMIIARQQANAQMDQSLRMTPLAKYTPVLHAAFNEFYDFAQKFISQCDAVVLAADLKPEGISGAAIADFQPQSDLGLWVAGAKDTTDSLLTGLPDGKYIAIYGVQGDRQRATEVLNAIINPLLPAIQQMGDDGKIFQSYIDPMKEIAGATDSGTAAMVAPEGDLGVNPLIQFIGIRRGDAKAIADGNGKILQLQQDNMQKMMVGNPLPMQITYTPSAKTLEGIAFDDYHTGFNLGAAANPQMAQVGQIMGFVYGQDGLNIYSGAINDTTFMQVGGLPDDKFTAAIDAAKANADTIGQLPGIQATASQLPKSRLGVAYFPLDTLVNTGFGYAAKFGLDMGVTMPPAPPIGMTIGTENSTIRSELFIPGQLITEGVEVGKKLAGLRHMGQPGAAPAGAAPAPAAGGGL